MKNDVLRALSHLDREELLGRIGLESRRSPLERLAPSLATFGAGLLVGAGLALLLGGGATARRRAAAPEAPAQAG